MGTDNLFHKRKAKAAEAHSRKKASRKPYERILIVCEGEKTELLYFTALRRALGLHPANVVIADKKRGLDPASLVAYALEELKKDPDFNHLYCVFDQDKHTTYEAALDRIRALKPKGGAHIHAITSIPCFEVWLLLHFEYTTKPFQAPAGESNCALVLAELRKGDRLPGYEKGGRYIFAGIAERLATAVHNARKLDEHHTGIGTDNPSTKVYVLVEKLQSLTL